MSKTEECTKLHLKVTAIQDQLDELREYTLKLIDERDKLKAELEEIFNKVHIR